jgi:hypothetical protein
MKNIINWFKIKFGTITLALSNVEKNALSQTGELMSTDTNKFQRHTQGQLADSLINGEVTQEVLNLKWRTYKILKASEGVSAVIVGYDEDGMPIVKTKAKNNKIGLKKVKLDTYDDYKLEMVIDNSEITLSGSEAMDNKHINLLDEVTINDEAIGQTATHGVIESNEHYTTTKSERPIKINREIIPNFFIENYTKKMNVRKIGRNKKMLEFYVSKYPDGYNKNSNLFINNLKKLMDGGSQTLTEIKEVEFVTYKSLGVSDFLEFKYEILEFDKVVEFNGFYVIKFIAKVVTNGNDIFEQHKVVELDKKYENKEKK